MTVNYEFGILAKPLLKMNEFLKKEEKKRQPIGPMTDKTHDYLGVSDGHVLLQAKCLNKAHLASVAESQRVSLDDLLPKIEFSTCFLEYDQFTTWRRKMLALFTAFKANKSDLDWFKVTVSRGYVTFTPLIELRATKIDDKNQLAQVPIDLEIYESILHGQSLITTYHGKEIEAKIMADSLLSALDFCLHSKGERIKIGMTDRHIGFLNHKGDLRSYAIMVPEKKIYGFLK